MPGDKATYRAANASAVTGVEWLWPKVRPAAQAMAHDHQQPSFPFSCRNPVIGNLAVMVV